jgi:HK97 family phage portal protein
MRAWQQCREAIGLALAQEAELVKLIESGMRPTGVLTFESAMSNDAIERAQVQFNALKKVKGTAILDGNAKYHPLGMSGVDMQFLEMRRHQVAEIARAFRVPLNMLQELERITHQNAEQLGRQFLQFTMLPWLTMWEHELNPNEVRQMENRAPYAGGDDFLRPLNMEAATDA